MNDQKRILLVDDDEGVLFVLQHALTTLDNDYEIATARHGQTALTRMREDAFDVVVTDLRMPDMDGVELTEAVRELDPTAIVIWITAYDCYRRRDEAARLQVYRCLDKPLEIHEIRDTVSAAVRQGLIQPNVELNGTARYGDASIPDGSTS
jgi:DNA-binding NtrC family response regulator